MGKQAQDLQTGIVVNENEKTISGQLKKVTDYTGFSDEPEEQTGNYLALKVVIDELIDKPEKTTVEIVGGTKGPVALDKDMMWVGLIKDTSSQQIKIVSTKGENNIAKVYSLKSLELLSE